MSTTTQILFNSPALHSLKRDQLVKLCKIHSIKASGKNTELIEKLRKHAETLPKDSPLSIAARSENPKDEGSDGDRTMRMEEWQATTEEPSPSANAHWGFQTPRPSSQWEVVMDPIEEAEEDSFKGTLTSIRTTTSNRGSGEFGTDTSMSSSVASSLKSLASSFSLKKAGMPKSALASALSFSPSSKSALNHATFPDDDTLGRTIPYSSLPEATAPLQTDHFTFDPMQGVETVDSADGPLPLPGHSLRPGVPAPDNARLSLGLNAPSTPTRDQPTTTIRLISNPVSNDSPNGRTPKLQPFKTSFELEFGSPQPQDSIHHASLWPQNGVHQDTSIYPPLPLDDFTSTSGASTSSQHVAETMDIGTPIPGSLAPAPKRAVPSFLTPALKSSSTPAQVAFTDPFVFGSPLPQHNVSNTQFKSAAASVLEEMNKRLHKEGVDGVGMDLISKLQPGAHTSQVAILAPHEAKDTVKTNGIKEKFDELHAEEFNKMEGIDSLVRRRGLVPKSDAALASKKRRSSMGVGRDRFGRRVGGESGRLSAASVVGERRRSVARVIPGSFGDEESDGEEDNAVEDATKGHLSATTEDAKEENIARAAEDEEKAKAELEEQKQKEKEAIKKKLELNKARRRSSVGAGGKGRVSIGRGGVIVKPQPTPKPKFGFFSTAKSLVQRVWGGGKAAATPTAKTAAKVTKPAPAPVPAPAPKKAPARPSTATNPPVGRIPSVRNKDNKGSTASSSTASTHSRPRLPSFAPNPSVRTSSVKASQGSSIARKESEAPAKSDAGVSSLGTRSSLASTTRSTSSGTVGSLGTRKAVADSSSRSSIPASGSASSAASRNMPSKLPSSRLLAPTASSLAKMNRTPVSGSRSSLKNMAENSGHSIQAQKSHGNEGEKLGAITNNPRRPGEPWSPRRHAIFSKPLTMPSPVKKPSASTDGVQGEGKDAVGTTGAGASGAPTRQRSIRKPRISRSKVIAKLASQRATGATGPVPLGSTPGAKAGRMRSSLGVKAQRSSFSGKSLITKGPEDSVAMSARKRVRQSEYARRKSRVAPIDFTGASLNAMDVDAE